MFLNPILTQAVTSDIQNHFEVLNLRYCHFILLYTLLQRQIIKMNLIIHIFLKWAFVQRKYFMVLYIYFICLYLLVVYNYK